MAALPDSLVYLNGRFVPYSQASLSVDDRGTMFGDGVYEILEWYAGQPFLIQAHVDRLRRSMEGIHLPEPATVAHLPAISDELVRRHGLEDARVYWQVTRGPAPRNHLPPANPTPTVLVTCTPITAPAATAPVASVKAITHDDLRWARCCYKTLMLLPNTLAKAEAHRAGCQEAILHRDGKVTEGGSANVLAVRDGELWTHPADEAILPGITRALVLDLAREMGLAVHESAITLDQLRDADEVMITSTTMQVAAVTQVDGKPIGAGKPGTITTQLRRAFMQRLAQSCRPASQA